MADPDWIGRPPTGAYWGADSKTVYYDRKRENSNLRDLYRCTDGAPATQPIPDADLPTVDPRFATDNLARTRRLFTRNGNLFLQDLPSGQIHALTATNEGIYDPEWMTGDLAIQFRRGGNIIIRDLTTGLERQAADIRFEKSPEQKRKDEDQKRAKAPLAEQQERALFAPLTTAAQRAREEEDRAIALAKSNPNHVPGPFYLPEKLEPVRTSLSPAGDTLLIIAADHERTRARSEILPQYIEDDGYIAAKPVRPLVGTPPRPNRLFALNLKSETYVELDLSTLPGISEDPLAEIKAANRARLNFIDIADTADDASLEGKHPTSRATTSSSRPTSQPATRPVDVDEIRWSRDGLHAAVVVASADHKDRWIALLAPGEKSLTPLQREHDPAWVNENLFSLDFTRDSKSLYFTSEQTGYNQLYLHTLATHETRSLTNGKFEVSDITEDPAHPFLYARANPVRPVDYEVIRVPLNGGPFETVTSTQGGLTAYELSPDATKLLLTASAPTTPPELYESSLASPLSTLNHQLSTTASKSFTSTTWITPEITPIPTRDGKQVWTKVLLDPTTPLPPSGHRPIVVFVHGAGYLQNVHSHFTSYFREQMFDTLLAQEGFLVLEPDYRGSAGYGRDGRTSIYRHMGSPELDDVEDAIAYAAKTYNADPNHVGIYGGSYGGFLSLMAAFTRPGHFAAAAALRPVTDWSHYNHGYTSEILNTPDVDPLAYHQSSPIYFADGLSMPLLICHGIVDDNVFVQDTIRVQERLIELGKQNFEVALYPVESHGFENPSSWLDEYRRILALFARHLK
jgi:dipeptidyl aminopeptidase/acylaminoacyl peptidase